MKGLNYLHNEAGILHRDIKPQNILLGENFSAKDGIRLDAKLCDFGVSEKLEAPFQENDKITKTAGTYHFFPPECCDCHTDNFSGMAVDVWSLGVTLYCMIFNELPFWDSENCENEFSILEYILKSEVVVPQDTKRIVVNDQEYEQHQDDELYVSEALIAIMFRMLDKDSATRITVGDCLVEVDRIMKKKSDK